MGGDYFQKQEWAAIVFGNSRRPILSSQALAALPPLLCGKPLAFRLLP
jgi:hypothetical protein